MIPTTATPLDPERARGPSASRKLFPCGAYPDPGRQVWNLDAVAAEIERRLLVGCWFGVRASSPGLGVLVDHAATAGAAALAPERWPVMVISRATTVGRRSRCSTLSVRARRRRSRELQRQLVAQLPDRPRSTSSLLAAGRQASRGTRCNAHGTRRPAGARVHDDPGGVRVIKFRCARRARFCSRRRRRQLRFAGGITPARAHQGTRTAPGIDGRRPRRGRARWP